VSGFKARAVVRQQGPSPTRTIIGTQAAVGEVDKAST
jgi:hypothetical protein